MGLETAVDAEVRQRRNIHPIYQPPFVDVLPVPLNSILRYVHSRLRNISPIVKSIRSRRRFEHRKGVGLTSTLPFSKSAKVKTVGAATTAAFRTDGREG